MSDRTKTILKLTLGVIALWAFTFLMLALAGCKGIPIKPVNHTSDITTHTGFATTALVSVEQQHSAARQDLAAAKPLVTQPQAKAAVESADQHVAAAQTYTEVAKTQVAQADAAAKKVGEEDFKTQQQLAAAQAKINELNSQFFSPRQKRDFWLIAITFVLLSGAMGVLKQIGTAEPAVAGIYHVMMVPVTIGLSIAHAIGQGIGWLLKKLATWAHNRGIALEAAIAAKIHPAVAK